MASENNDHILESEIPESDRPRTPEQLTVQEGAETSPPQSVLSHRPRESPQKPAEPKKPDSLSVLVSAPARPWEYQPYQGDITVETVIKETPGPDSSIWYKIEFESGSKKKVCRAFLSFLALLCVWGTFFLSKF